MITVLEKDSLAMTYCSFPIKIKANPEYFQAYDGDKTRQYLAWHVIKLNMKTGKNIG